MRYSVELQRFSLTCKYCTLVRRAQSLSSFWGSALRRLGKANFVMICNHEVDNDQN